MWLLVATILNNVDKKLLFRILKKSLFYERILLATHANLQKELQVSSSCPPSLFPLSRRNLDRSQEIWSTIIGRGTFPVRNKVLKVQLAGPNHVIFLVL